MTQQLSLLDTLAGDPDIAALLDEQAQVRAMVRVETALAQAAADAGMIEEEAAAAIKEGLKTFAPDWSDLAVGMARDGVVVPALVTQMRGAIAAPYGADLHKGATSQDIVDTALVLQLVQVIKVYVTRLGALLDRLDALDEQFGAQPMMAHTRMQQALPYSVGAKLATWAAPLRRHLDALKAIRPTLLVIQLGGPVGDRSSFGGHGEAVARGLARALDLGLAEPWQTARDPLMSLASHAAMISGTLGKIGADVAIEAQNEVGAVALAGGGTSSSMMHKSNPVNAEVLVTLARYNAGLVGTLLQAMVHENERSGAAWTLEWLVLPKVLITTGASLRLATKLMNQLSFR